MKKIFCFFGIHKFRNQEYKIILSENNYSIAMSNVEYCKICNKEKFITVKDIVEKL